MRLGKKTRVLRLNSFEKLRADPETNECDGAENQRVETETKRSCAGQSAADAVNSVGQRIETNDSGENSRQTGQRKKRAGEKKQRHDQEVNDQGKTLHVVQLACQHRAESGKEKRKQKHENKS